MDLSANMNMLNNWTWSNLFGTIIIITTIRYMLKVVFKMVCKNKPSDETNMIFNKDIHTDIASMAKPGEAWYQYANTWYPVVKASELKRGQIKPLYIFGKNLVIYRTVSNKVHVLDAFCAHWGAHLGVNGSVIGEDIRCPFHSWTFNGGGECTSVPGIAASNLPKAKIKTWQSYEANDWLYVWYHSDDQEPKWKPVVLLEPQVLKQKVIEFQSINRYHIADLFANTADSTHFEEVHSMAVILPIATLLRKGSFYDLAHKILHWEIESGWKAGEEHEKHLSRGTMTMAPAFLGRPVECLRLTFESIVCPPVFRITAHLPYFNVTSHYMKVLVTSGSMTWHLHKQSYSDDNTFMSKLFAFLMGCLTNIAFEADVWLIQNKTFMSRPYYTSEDKFLKKYYNWFHDNFYKN